MPLTAMSPVIPKTNIEQSRKGDKQTYSTVRDTNLDFCGERTK